MIRIALALFLGLIVCATFCGCGPSVRVPKVPQSSAATDAANRADLAETKQHEAEALYEDAKAKTASTADERDAAKDRAEREHAAATAAQDDARRQAAAHREAVEFGTSLLAGLAVAVGLAIAVWLPIARTIGLMIATAGIGYALWILVYHSTAAVLDRYGWVIGLALLLSGIGYLVMTARRLHIFGAEAAVAVDATQIGKAAQTTWNKLVDHVESAETQLFTKAKGEVASVKLDVAHIETMAGSALEPKLTVIAPAHEVPTVVITSTDPSTKA